MASQDDKKVGSPIQVITNNNGDMIYSIQSDQDIPEQLRMLPVFPTEDTVIFPSALVVMTTRDPLQIAAINQAMQEREHVAVMAVRARQSQHDVRPRELASFYAVATYARILKVAMLDSTGETVQVTMRGIQRIAPVWMGNENNLMRVNAQPVEEIPLAIIGEAVYEDHTLLRTVKQSARKFFENQPVPDRDPRELLRIVEQTKDAGVLTDFLAAQIDMPYVQRAALLCTPSVRVRLQTFIDILASQYEVARIINEAAQKVRVDLDKQQRDYFIKQHIKQLNKQIGEEQENDNEELKAEIDKLDADPAVIEYLMKMWKRLAYIPPASAEYAAARAHIETVIDIPWHKRTDDHINIHEAREILEADHYGLEKVKKRVLEHLAVLALKQDLKSPIICLYGPPGVGKTSIGKSIARALNRKFERISLGGIHDESDIRGHRRTYVASMPGRIVQALRHAQTINPVIMLDEIDKITRSNHGDPASALLEALDPEQNSAFVDNYIETPIDLSNVLFITTANSLETIPGPLRDRMEIIEVQGYTHIDKRAIATDFLMPKLLKQHGLCKSNLAISSEALDIIISNHTRESGVRQLEQKLSAICRQAAARVIEAREEGKKRIKVNVTAKNLEDFLGKKRFEYDIVEKERLPGISTGLAWTPFGGDILFIEATDMPGKGELSVTGQLGDVMKESVRAAMTLVRSRAEKLGLDSDVFKNRDVHIHFPDGATPKDGPSAGAAIFTALLSLFKNESVSTTLAMTGEISLRGNVLPVGGIREKVLAAHRAGIRTILLPERNNRDLDDVPEFVRHDIHFVMVNTIDDVIHNVFHG